MKLVEELRKKIIEEAISYYLNNKDISIKECAKKFDMNAKTLSNYLKKTQKENYLHYNNYGKCKYRVDSTFFNNIDTEEKAYWLGFLTADGCIFKNRPQIRLALAEKDYDHVVKFKKSLKAEHNVTIAPAGGFIKKDGTHSMAAIITIQNLNLYNDLIGFGFSSTKSCNEKPVKNLPPHLIRHYIRGIFDGDGWISFGMNHRDLGFGMGEEILTYIKQCFEKYANIKSTYKVLIYKNIYRYRISSKIEMLKALDYMYENSTIYLDRKHSKYLKFKNAVLNQQIHED